MTKIEAVEQISKIAEANNLKVFVSDFEKGKLSEEDLNRLIGFIGDIGEHAGLYFFAVPLTFNGQPLQEEDFKSISDIFVTYLQRKYVARPGSQTNPSAVS